MVNKNIYGDNSIFLRIKLEEETISEGRTLVNVLGIVNIYCGP
jgi:hypothetical protein